jgi:hypothetical protein
MKQNMFQIKKAAMLAVFAAAGVGAVGTASAGCYSYSNVGSVCVNKDSRGYQAVYTRTGSGNVRTDFNLYCANGRWFGDLGAFNISQGQTRTYVFSVGSQGSCQVRLVASNGYYPSPYLNR